MGLASYAHMLVFVVLIFSLAPPALRLLGLSPLGIEGGFFSVNRFAVLVLFPQPAGSYTHTFLCSSNSAFN